MVRPIPDGYGTVTPHLVCRDCAGALEWYGKAFGAEELMRMPMPDGKTLMHAEMRIGNSAVMLADEFPMPDAPRSPQSLDGTSVSLNLYVEDCDQAVQRAVDAGARLIFPPTDMFWGDRFAKVQDPYGHQWGIMTHTEDLTPEEIGRRAAEACKDLG